jgi:hypothetical protein
MSDNFENKRIEVCDRCLCACCWYGEFMCDGARHAGTRVMTVGELRLLNRENEENWGAEKMVKMYGDAEPFGYGAATEARGED